MSPLSSGPSPIFLVYHHQVHARDVGMNCLYGCGEDIGGVTLTKVTMRLPHVPWCLSSVRSLYGIIIDNFGRGYFWRDTLVTRSLSADC